MTHRNSKKLMPWRAEVAAAAAREALLQDWAVTKDDPVSAHVHFYFPRPRAHYRTSGALKDAAPHWRTSFPDVDKLLRALFDALVKAEVIHDDRQIVIANGEKLYGDPRAEILLRRLP
jgi:Holliday junction resolvase RusA-like endonuclease